jgi:NAD(P)-dependent dehydrogenase (short-subunit alcohol dehydrogenase family)
VKSAFLTELFSLDGRVALVTGASGGIGRALAHGLAMAGARVALTGRSVDMLAAAQREIAEDGGDSAVFPADISELTSIDPLVQSVLDRFGQVDILVNCAGINKREPIAEVEPDTYEKIMDVNLRAAYFLSQAVLPSMRERGGGKIVNIGSINTTFGLGTVSVYGMAKAGLAQMTRVMAVEWASHNIQVNCLCPGFIKTELTMPLWEDEHRRTWVLDRVPIRRPGLPSDLVGMAIYLAARASDFTTGQTLYVDGGFLAGGQW